MLVGGGQSLSSSTPDFALQCNPVCLLPVSSPGYLDLHNNPQPHSVSAYEGIHRTQKVFLWLLWAVGKATKSLPMPRTPLSTLVPIRPFGIPVFSTFHNVLEVCAVKLYCCIWQRVKIRTRPELLIFTRLLYCQHWFRWVNGLREEWWGSAFGLLKDTAWAGTKTGCPIPFRFLWQWRKNGQGN